MCVCCAAEAAARGLDGPGAVARGGGRAGAARRRRGHRAHQGQGRAAELLYTGRALGGNEAESWGFYNRIFEPKDLLDASKNMAERLANGPTFANGVTKMMLNKEWNMGMDEFIEAEAQAQAICMQTQDFKRAYNAFISKEKPIFEGN